MCTHHLPHVLYVKKHDILSKFLKFIFIFESTQIHDCYMVEDEVQQNPELLIA